jgi:hypothetical protein
MVTRVCAKERAVHTDVKTATAGWNSGSDTASGRTVRDCQRMVGERVAHMVESTAAIAGDCFPAWLDGQHHQRRRHGGDTTRRTWMTVTLARRPGTIGGKGGDQRPEGEGGGEERLDVAKRKMAALVEEVEEMRHRGSWLHSI